MNVLTLSHVEITKYQPIRQVHGALWVVERESTQNKMFHFVNTGIWFIQNYYNQQLICTCIINTPLHIFQMDNNSSFKKSLQTQNISFKMILYAVQKQFRRIFGQNNISIFYCPCIQAQTYGHSALHSCCEQCEPRYLYC